MTTHSLEIHGAEEKAEQEQESFLPLSSSLPPTSEAERKHDDSTFASTPATVAKTAFETSRGLNETDGLIGSWTLLCATASATLEGGPLDKIVSIEKIAGFDTNKLPSFNDDPVKQIRNTLHKCVKIEQVIKSVDSDAGIDRLEYAIEYFPPDILSAFLKNLPDAIKALNINPLQVSESKISLMHKAEIETVVPVIKTKLSLESIVVNVAGKSKVLNPEGADMLGVNVPFGDFLNAGSSETTYMDDKIRISRSKIGIVDQLCVCIRSEHDGSHAVEAEDAHHGKDGNDIAPVSDDSAPSD